MVVALSGGKDSLSLCLALQEFKIEFVAVIVDMGYEAGWADRVRSHAISVGVAPEVVDVRRNAARSDARFITLASNLAVLDKPQTPIDTFTPCTYCYNAKVIALEETAHRLGASRIAFGHHRTDACASLLKEALMHIDRWDRGHESYQRSQFEDLVASLHEDAQCCTTDGSSPPLIRRITDLVENGRVDTDEPPRQRLREGCEIDIVRPMFFVDEGLISATVADAELQTEGSGCGHGATVATQTPREMVHFRILAVVENAAFSKWLSGLLGSCVARDGYAKVEARRRRAELLGGAYKPVAVGLDKF
ncbi:MAG: hypothetical protein WB998_12870 [Solirubrobacteraceae bacterium]